VWWVWKVYGDGCQWVPVGPSRASDTSSVSVLEARVIAIFAVEFTEQHRFCGLTPTRSDTPHDV
jgi:hypothetical protein